MKQINYKNYLLILLMFISVFNYVDRWALGILLEDIKADLDLTDTQLGLLSGIAFALFYSVMGVPIARWADRGNRVTIVTLTTALWSAAVALSGMATSFTQLLLIRIGVAVGEAGCLPTAHSLIADHFTRAERPRAVSRYLLSMPLSLVIGYLVTGWLNQFYGWRVSYFFIGLPGLVLAVLAWFTLKEPRRMKGAMAKLASRAEAPRKLAVLQPSLNEVVVTLWANTAFRHLLFCSAVTSFFGYGIQQWLPAFFIRSHGLQTGEVGTWFAAVYGIGGGLGIYLGGELATRYAAGKERLQLTACALLLSISVVFEASAYFAPNHYLAFGSLALGALANGLTHGPIFAVLQTLVSARMRAMSISIIYLFANLIGLGFGPLAAGALSDALRPWLGEESLRYALLMLSPGYFWAVWHMQRAGRTVGRDVAGAQAEDDSRAMALIKMDEEPGDSPVAEVLLRGGEKRHSNPALINQ